MTSIKNLKLNRKLLLHLRAIYKLPIIPSSSSMMTINLKRTKTLLIGSPMIVCPHVGTLFLVIVAFVIEFLLGFVAGHLQFQLLIIVIEFICTRSRQQIMYKLVSICNHVFYKTLLFNEVHLPLLLKTNIGSLFYAMFNLLATPSVYV